MHWSIAGSVSKGQEVPGLRSLSATLVGSRVFIFGGEANKKEMNDLYIFDAETLFWYKPRVYGMIPEPRRGHTSCYIDNKLYLYGGDLNTRSSSLFIFDINNYNWTKPEVKGTSPGPLRGHAAGSLGKKVFIFGGGDGVHAVNNTFVLDTEKLEWTEFKTSSPPAARGYSTASLIDDKMYIFGGQNGETFFGDLSCLDLGSGTWSNLKISNPHLLSIHSATSVGHRIVIFGGHNSQNFINDVKILNLDPRVAKQNWNTIKCSGTIPAPRGYHQSVHYDSRLFVFGGMNEKQYFNNIAILDMFLF